MAPSPNEETMTRYSIFSIARNAMNYHKDWERAWRSPAPKAEYDAVIVGAGGHGLASAYYLAKEHGLRALKRTSHANRLAGLDCRIISRAEVKRLVPLINDAPDARYPVLAAYY